MRLERDIKPWLFPVEPKEGESLSHFLGRVRRRNHLSCTALGDLADIGSVIARWEKFLDLLSAVNDEDSSNFKQR